LKHAEPGVDDRPSELSPSTFVGGPIEATIVSVPAVTSPSSPSTFVGGPIEAYGMASSLACQADSPSTFVGGPIEALTTPSVVGRYGVLSVDVCRRPH